LKSTGSFNKPSSFSAPKDSNHSGFSKIVKVPESELKKVEESEEDPFMISELEPGTQCGPTDFIFSEIGDLRPEDKSYFQARKFEMFKIPRVPPARENC
jgi:hypothetical protein